MNVNDSLLDLNNTERKLLTQLPGVTKDVAHKIVNYRKQHGGFGDWSDVQKALGFSQRAHEDVATSCDSRPKT